MSHQTDYQGTYYRLVREVARRGFAELETILAERDWSILADGEQPTVESIQEHEYFAEDVDNARKSFPEEERMQREKERAEQAQRERREKLIKKLQGPYRPKL